MANRLGELRDQASPRAMKFMNDRLARLLSGRLAGTTNAAERFPLQFVVALQQLQAGWPGDALASLAEMEALARLSGAEIDRRTQTELQLRRGLAFLRLGEQENCIANHNADSCLFPLKPSAYHPLPRGSLGAIEAYASHLNRFPSDLGTRWLLNLAHMTLGQYPAKVDPRWLIPPAAFASEASLPRFPNIASHVGLDLNSLAGGVIADDFNNDGLLDVVVSAMNWEGQLRLFLNMGNGAFSERTEAAGLLGEVGALSIQQTDYNNDGFLDLWLNRGAWLGVEGRLPNSLLRNNGDGTFADVTEEAGLLSFHPTQASRWFDFDGDGWLDLFIGNESTDPDDPDWSELYRNNRDGTFTECARDSGLAIAQFVKGVACADYDRDGRPDLYLSLREGPNILLHNDGPVPRPPPLRPGWKFTDVTAQAGPVDEPYHSFATFFFDYDNDGWQDLAAFGYFLTNGVADIAATYLDLPSHGSRTRLFRNNGNGTFTDVSTNSRLHRVIHAMGINYGDIDNDGWIDFYAGTGDPDLRTVIPNLLFRNHRGRYFQDVTTTTGTGHLQKGHGIAFADFDEDGDQDIFAAMGGAYSGDRSHHVLFLNPLNPSSTPGSNQWLTLDLVGTKANRAAIGAEIKVELDTPNGPREIHRVVSSGASFGSNPLRQEIGLGNASAIRSVRIVWPGSGTIQSFREIAPNRRFRIREGDSSPIPLNTRIIPWPTAQTSLPSSPPSSPRTP